MKKKYLSAIFILCLVGFFGLQSCDKFPCCHNNKNAAENLDLRSRVRRITLDNGMKVLLLHRDGAPVFSEELQVKVGNTEEHPGSYGLAHFFEHMAFKGTSTIGSKDFSKEKPILDQVLALGTKIVELRKQGKTEDELADLNKQLKDLMAEEDKYINKNEFTEVLQKNGGEDLNASTSNDFTTFYVSLPANKLELWAYMESARLKDRVLREFFTEKQVVAEERRMRMDNTPSGQLFEAYANAAFDSSPYKVAVIGPAAEIQNYVPSQAIEFYQKYYIPSRMVLVLVGNIDLDETEKIVRQYFGVLPRKDDPNDTFKGEHFDPKTFPRTATVTGPEKARFYLGYHRPAHPHPDDIVFDVIQDIFCEGRTARLYQKLVIEEKKASQVSCYVSIPGSRLDSLFTFFAMPLDGHTNQELEKDIKSEIEKLAKEGPTQHELEKIKNSIDAELIYSLESNAGLASQLAFYESLTGNWEYIYELQERIHKMTAEDVKRVVQTYLVKDREVTTYYEQK